MIGIPLVRLAGQVIATCARVLGMLALFAIPVAAWAFDLSTLEQQLRASPVVRGAFVQEKYLRALPQPLRSEGTFVLAPDKGLLWTVQRPLQQALRITPQGIARREADGRWLTSSSQPGGGRETRLFLALLQGDTQILSSMFGLALSGEADGWRLVMTPVSPVLKQIFTTITVSGSAYVDAIEMVETQGDRTVLRLIDMVPGTELNPEERHAYAS